jgi:hypothetical protein
MLSASYSLLASLYGQTASRTRTHGLVVPARHAKKSQNMGVNQNLGANQEFTVFHCI